MKILITGGTGFIGSNLCQYFTQQGFQVFVLTRNLNKNHSINNNITLINELNDITINYDIIINLAGEPLNKNRWNKKIKKMIYASRIQTTQKIIEYIKNAYSKPKLLISGSAIGFYGQHPNESFIENSKPVDEGFTHRLCNDWEKIAEEATMYGVRVCLLRMGIVLGKNGGILKEMLPLFKIGLGAQLGNGKQWMSWIHIKDVVSIIDFLINTHSLSGPFNLTSPESITNKLFSRKLANALHRPLILTLPNFLVKILFGEMGKNLLLSGQKVIPKKLMAAGYIFKFPKFSLALANIIK